MKTEFSAHQATRFAGHLSEEDLNDVLIGLGSPESDAHLVVCNECRDQVEHFRSEVEMFKQTSLAWSEARSLSIPRISRPKATPAILNPVAWAAAAALLLMIGIPVWNNDHRAASDQGTAQVQMPSDSEAQIAQDNALLQSVDAVLSAGETSPINEYDLSAGPASRVDAQSELRNP
jgi:hypothetical protein